MKVNKLLIVLIMLFISHSLFAGGFALTGVGSRASSMACAFRGLSDDGSGPYWIQVLVFRANSFDLGLYHAFKQMKNNTLILGTPICLPGYEHKEYEAKSILRSFPSGSIVFAKSPVLKFALGIFVPYGLGATWDAYQLPSGIVTPQGTMPTQYLDGFPKEELMSSLAIVDIHPTAAYQVKENLSIGTGLSIYYSLIQLKTVDFNPALGDLYPYMPITTNL